MTMYLIVNLTPNYQPTEVYVAEDTLENSIDNVGNIAQVLNVGLLRFQI